MKMCIFGFNKMTELKLHVKTWDQLDLDTWYAISRLRNAVFVVEQDCVYQDLDGVDSRSKHVYLTDSEQHIAAYARIVPKGLIYPEHSIGRVLVDDQNRGRQLGRRLMKACMEVVEKELPGSPIRISAQVYLTVFYESLGFIKQGDSYLEDGIPHIEMLKK